MSDDSRRRPVIWALGISRLSRVFAELTPSYAGRADFRIVDEGFEAAAAAINRAAARGAVDAVVSGGANAAYLRQHVDVPVVTINVSGFDVMHALTAARRLSPRVALVTHSSTFPEAEAFKDAFGLSFSSRCYETTDDAVACVEALKREGVQAIAGPGLVSDLAVERGMAGVFLYSTTSVRVALEDAIEATRLTRIEQRRRDYLNTVLSSLHDGVAAVDAQGAIQSLNPSMERLLGLSAHAAMGMRLDALVPALALDGPLRQGRKELETIQRVGDKVLITNRIPIEIDGGVVGVVVTAQDAKAIQRVDRSLRVRASAPPRGTRYAIDDLLGESPQIQRVRQLARQYAEVSSTVLIEGESGTGKEVLAQGMHQASPRRDFPFVAVNCAAFPEALLESELFGYEEGAFSGARRGGKTGLFEVAHNGTIFLDEIGDMPAALQVRLLRVLQERQVLPVGAVEPVAVNVRIIAATHRDLRQAVREGGFREDLFYRIDILRIYLPPLREREGDAALLAAVLYRRAQQRLGLPGRAALPARVGRLCASYAWPGNLREMENILERIAVLLAGKAPAGKELDDALRLTAPELFAGPPHAVRDAADAAHVPLAALARNAQAAHAREVLAACGGNRAEACRRLGISPTTLWRKLREGEAAGR